MRSKVIGLDICIRCSVLLLLSRGTSHGYELSGALKKFKLFNEPGNSSASIYAYLRRMEEEGLILSEWTIEGKQKPKRVYSLTESGRSKLGELVASVAECAGALFELVEIYRKQVLSAD